MVELRVLGWLKFEVAIFEAIYIKKKQGRFLVALAFKFLG